MSDATTVERYTARFWAALDNGEFLFHRCGDCERAFFPPTPVCPHCGATDVAWETADGMGTLYSFTRQHTAPPGFEPGDVLGIIELVEGPRVLVLVEAAYDDLTIGQTVELVPVEYEAGFDRGDLDGQPYFVARPQ